ncbi:MAG: carboxypeptidase-like regulatory domain-containing protein [Candidatus Sericytochromatia bacterium]
MFASRQSFVALGLVASLLLAGCGAPAVGTLAPVSKGGKAPVTAGIQAPAPSVTVTRGTDAGRQVHVPLNSSVTVSHVDMTEDEMAEDASFLGLSLFAAVAESKVGQKFNKTGIVRKTETGWAFTASKGLFKKKENTVFTLTGSEIILNAIAGRENKKALIKGVVDKDNVVTVESVKGLADLGFLTNWFTKGKAVGEVTDAAGKALTDVKVSVKSADGFVLSATSNADGEFEIKGLTPDTYTVTFSKAGFKPASQTFTVAKRQSVNLVASLVAVPVETTPETGNGNGNGNN